MKLRNKIALLIIAVLALIILIRVVMLAIPTQKANVHITGQLEVTEYDGTYAIKGTVYNAGEATAHNVKIVITTEAHYPDTICNIGNLAPKESRDFYGSYTPWFPNHSEYYVWSNIKVEWD